jgi:hypothetical protein
MGFAPLALGIAGAAISAGSALFGGIAQGHAAAYEAQVSRNEQTVAQQNAAYAAAAGSQQAAEKSLQARATLSRIRVAQAAGGVDINTGSNQDVQTSQRETGTLEEAQTEQNALLQSYGYKAAAETAGAQSTLYSAQAAQEPWAGIFSGLGTLASDAGTLPFGWGGSSTPDYGTGAGSMGGHP